MEQSVVMRWKATKIIPHRYVIAVKRLLRWITAVKKMENIEIIFDPVEKRYVLCYVLILTSYADKTKSCCINFKFRLRAYCSKPCTHGSCPSKWPFGSRLVAYWNRLLVLRKTERRLKKKNLRKRRKLICAKKGSLITWQTFREWSWSCTCPSFMGKPVPFISKTSTNRLPKYFYIEIDL